MKEIILKNENSQQIKDIEKSIKNVVQQNDYDHIFVIIRLGNEEFQNDIKINDWIGLRSNGLLWNRVFKY